MYLGAMTTGGEKTDVCGGNPDCVPVFSMTGNPRCPSGYSPSQAGSSNWYRCMKQAPKPASGPRITVSPVIQTQVSPQISPVFQQAFQPTGSPMSAGTAQTSQTPQSASTAPVTPSVDYAAILAAQQKSQEAQAKSYESLIEKLMTRQAEPVQAPVSAPFPSAAPVPAHVFSTADVRELQRISLTEEQAITPVQSIEKIPEQSGVKKYLPYALAGAAVLLLVAMTAKKGKRNVSKRG